MRSKGRRGSVGNGRFADPAPTSWFGGPYLSSAGFGTRLDPISGSGIVGPASTSGLDGSSSLRFEFGSTPLSAFGAVDSAPISNGIGGSSSSSGFEFGSTPLSAFGASPPLTSTSAFGGATSPSTLEFGYPVLVSSGMLTFASPSTLDAALPAPTGVFGDVTSSGFGFGSTSFADLGTGDHASTGALGGATTPSALGFGSITPGSASSGPFGSSLAPTSTNPFGGDNTEQRAEAAAKNKSNAEAILVAILERNLRLEYVVVPTYCLESEAVVNLAEESLPLLKEFYSQDDLWKRDSADEFYLSDTAYGTAQTFGTKSKGYLQGYIRQFGGARSLLLLKNYPRLRALQSDIAARINREVLDTLRKADKRLTILRISCGGAVPQTCRQILMEVSGLTSIYISQYGRDEKIPFDDMDRLSFLKHAPTLECLSVGGCGFDDETVLALLRACPLLKTLMATGEPHGYRPRMEAELDASSAISSPWVCDLLETFVCKITRVPRPDIAVIEIGDDLDDWVLAPPSQVASNPIAVQESHDLQRKVLKQLGRLTHLRTLSLSTQGSNCDDPIYSQLEIKGIRTMIVEGSVQTDCLELTLESGLNELAGLKDLEEFSVYQMAHRIGVAEVRWMVDNWPKLKRLYGLRYEDSDRELERDSEDEEGDGDSDYNGRENERPEALVWMMENRPDIEVS